MAFVVEDGTGVSNANAYIDLAYANTYFDDRNNDDWTATNTKKQAAIIHATDYIDIRWGRLFLGVKEFTANTLEFPRLYLYDQNYNLVTGIPEKLKQATAEYALRSLTGQLMPDPEVDAGKIKLKREKVGPIEEETEYAQVVRDVKPYPFADRLLREFIRSGGGVYR